MPEASPHAVSLGANIRSARTAKDLTQLALAHAIGRVGINAGASICRIENGEETPRIDTLDRIAKVLGTTVHALIPPMR